MRQRRTTARPPNRSYGRERLRTRTTPISPKSESRLRPGDSPLGSPPPAMDTRTIRTTVGADEMGHHRRDRGRRHPYRGATRLRLLAPVAMSSEAKRKRAQARWRARARARIHAVYIPGWGYQWQDRLATGRAPQPHLAPNSAGSVPKRVGRKVVPLKIGTQTVERFCTICQGPVIAKQRRTCSERCLAISRYRTKRLHNHYIPSDDLCPTPTISGGLPGSRKGH